MKHVNIDADQIYDISVLLGQRGTGGIQDWESGDTMRIALYAGGGTAADDQSPASIGATLLDSIDVNPFSISGTVLTERVTVSLSTGTALAGGEALYVAFETPATATGQKVLDNVTIESGIRAELVAPASGASHLPADVPFQWAPPAAVTVLPARRAEFFTAGDRFRPGCDKSV